MFSGNLLVNRFANLILFCLALVMLLFTLVGNHGLLHLERLKHEIKLMDTKNRELSAEATEVQNEIDAVKHSRAALEKRAREELGLAKENEIVYIFPSWRGEKPEAK